jgi:hypothetical protein
VHHPRAGCQLPVVLSPICRHLEVAGQGPGVTLFGGARAGRGRQSAVQIVWQGGFGVSRSSSPVPLLRSGS